MRVFTDPSQIPGDFGPTAVAIGKFDGVHLGHQALIQHLRTAAAARGIPAVVVTFDRNPLALLRPDDSPRDIVSVERKLDLLAETGADATLVLTFDAELAALDAAQFVRWILVEALNATRVLVGRDFRFGSGGAGDVALLTALGREDGFTVELVDDITGESESRRVSSSWIRELLANGQVAEAAALLGRPVSATGTVVHGLKRGRELGFPTANLSARVDSLIPRDGVYAGWLLDTDTGERFAAAISVGTNPTFGDVRRTQVEAHAIGRSDLDLYDRTMRVEFAEFLRGMAAFTSAEQLSAQITADVTAVRERLAAIESRQELGRGE